jgi:hypothetical protein
MKKLPRKKKCANCKEWFQLVMLMLCAIFGHKYVVLRVLNEGARQVGCNRCNRKWGMHDETMSFVPWDEELEQFYSPGGILNNTNEKETTNT